MFRNLISNVEGNYIVLAVFFFLVRENQDFLRFSKDFSGSRQRFSGSQQSFRNWPVLRLRQASSGNFAQNLKIFAENLKTSERTAKNLGSRSTKKKNNSKKYCSPILCQFPATFRDFYEEKNRAKCPFSSKYYRFSPEFLTFSDDQTKKKIAENGRICESPAHLRFQPQKTASDTYQNSYSQQSFNFSKCDKI